MQRGYNSSKKKVIVCFVIVLALILGYFLVDEVTKKPVCVSRTVSGDSEKIVTLNVEVSMFNKPNSFIIEERVSEGAILVSSQPKELFYENGRISWMFWDGGLKLKDTKIIYKLSNSVDDVQGRLVVAVDKNDPSKGYTDLIIANGRVCI